MKRPHEEFGSTLPCAPPEINAAERIAAGSPCPSPSPRRARRSSARTGDALADFGARADEHARVRRRDGDRQADDRVDLRHRILPRQGASTIPARRNLANPVQRVARRLALTDGDAAVAPRVDARRLAGEDGGEPVAAGRPQGLRNGGDRFRIAREIERWARSARRASGCAGAAAARERRNRSPGFSARGGGSDMVCVKNGTKPADRDGSMPETDRGNLLQAWRRDPFDKALAVRAYEARAALVRLLRASV